MAKNIFNSVENNFVGNANKQSYEGALRSGVVLGKYWSTCGKKDVRESHKRYEALGCVPMDYEYAPNLKFPADPNCKNADEINGCRCCITYKVD